MFIYPLWWLYAKDCISHDALCLMVEDPSYKGDSRGQICVSLLSDRVISRHQVHEQCSHPLKLSQLSRVGS